VQQIQPYRAKPTRGRAVCDWVTDCGITGDIRRGRFRYLAAHRHKVSGRLSLASLARIVPFCAPREFLSRKPGLTRTVWFVGKDGPGRYCYTSKDSYQNNGRAHVTRRRFQLGGLGGLTTRRDVDPPNSRAHFTGE
jgi:hypothetical protein